MVEALPLRRGHRRRRRSCARTLLSAHANAHTRARTCGLRDITAQDMATHGIRPIDLVIVNLYPFNEAVAAKPDDFSYCIENIDIGGPAMIRASAKNNAHVAICTSPAQYPKIMEEMSGNGGCTRMAFRRNLAAAAYALTSSYDAAVCGKLGGRSLAIHLRLGAPFPQRRPAHGVLGV